MPEGQEKNETKSTGNQETQVRTRVSTPDLDQAGIASQKKTAEQLRQEMVSQRKLKRLIEESG